MEFEKSFGFLLSQDINVRNETDSFQMYNFSESGNSSIPTLVLEDRPVIMEKEELEQRYIKIFSTFGNGN